MQRRGRAFKGMAWRVNKEKVRIYFEGKKPFFHRQRE
jgi:hypothetical protein